MTSDASEVGKLRVALDELRLINNLVTKISHVRETNHIMEIIIAELVQVTGADQGVISLVSPLEEEDLVTVVRDSSSDPDALPYQVSSLISGWVLREKRLLKVDDLDNDERFSGLSSEDGKYKSVVCCPMIVRDEPIGLTTLIRKTAKGPFGDDHCRLAGILASQTAQLLSNARLYEEVADKNRLLEISRKQLADENLQLKSEVGASFAFENIIGKSPAMKKVLSLTSRFADNESPVLITGDTGTGKELIAKAIHFNSRRKNKPFVIKNCGVKTETLLESELFGHIKGAFTGADRNKPGLFKQADGGTIFLDEIGEAPAPTQVAILRVLETGEIRPVGANATEYVDVRIISATNRDLSEEMADNNFRRDLFYRLNTFTIELPSLSHRRDDIPLLVHYFLKKLKIKLNNEQLSITPEALEVLSRYHWPGNIRQLENEIERAAVVNDLKGRIDVNDLSPTVRQVGGGELPGAAYRGPLRDAVGQLECDIIKSTLDEYDGNILQTSKVLGLTRKGLKDKITRYNISLDQS